MYNKQLKELIKNITNEIIGLRRQLHMFPELSMKEVKTSNVICNFLDNLGIEYRRIAETGVIALLLSNKNYPTIAIRAEMDALPMQDEKVCEYSSQNKGVTHSCGHDGIVSIALGLIRILYEYRCELKYNIKFIFEPGEEVGRGAKTMIESGALKDPKVEKIIIFHLDNSFSLSMMIRNGIHTAEISSLNIIIKGKSAHWAEASKAIDAISAAGKVICRIDEINRSYNAKMPFIIGIGTVSGGTKSNIISDAVVMKGNLRTFDEEDKINIYNLLKDIQTDIERETNALIEINTVSKIPPIYNDAKLAELGITVAEHVFGKEKIYTNSAPYLAGDNASFYFDGIKGMGVVFFAKKDGEVNYPLHNPKFDFNEDIIPLALETLSGIILKM